MEEQKIVALTTNYYETGALLASNTIYRDLEFHVYDVLEAVENELN